MEFSFLGIPKTAGAKIAFAEPGVQIKPVKPKMGLSWLQIAEKSDEGDQFLTMFQHGLNDDDIYIYI